MNPSTSGLKKIKIKILKTKIFNATKKNHILQYSSFLTNI
jgi:hypothetical protein